eukprot:scaffold150955_cov17-Prasinocladus_malaysianus.AAC.1
MPSSINVRPLPWPTSLSALYMIKPAKASSNNHLPLELAAAHGHEMPGHGGPQGEGGPLGAAVGAGEPHAAAAGLGAALRPLLPEVRPCRGQVLPPAGAKADPDPPQHVLRGH